MLFADAALSRRFERAEGMAGAAFAEARGGDAVWREMGGCIAICDTPQSPVTQTFGLGLFEAPTEAMLDRIEEFFISRGAQIHHEISPLADPSLWPLLTKRGYCPIEFTSLLFQELPATTTPGCNTLEVAIARDHAAWASTSAAGWCEDTTFAADLADLMAVSARSGGVIPFNVVSEGKPIAAGALNIQGDIALMAGASTIPAARRKGAQRALLAARLAHAAEAGCAIAMMGAAPGSASQRNAERNGFRIAYTRTKWARMIP